MLNPVYINIIDYRNGKPIIITSIIDLHISKMKRVIRQPDGFVSIFVEDGWLKLGISFEDLLQILREHSPIDMRFEEEVNSYIKDNFVGLKHGNNGEGSTNKN